MAEIFSNKIDPKGPSIIYIYICISYIHIITHVDGCNPWTSRQMATSKPQLPGRLNEIKSDPADQEVPGHPPAPLRGDIGDPTYDPT